jgi:predicted branched-subunit amino acid permease
VQDAVVLGIAVGVFGVAFGVLATTNGLTVAQAAASSVLIFTGASQFAAVSVVGAGGAPVAAAAGALLLASRNGLYGLAVAPILPRPLGRRLLAAQLVIDESTALAWAQTDPRARRGAFIAGGLSVFVFWNLGTLVGAVGGAAIGDPAALGLDAAFPAGFVALVAPLLRTRPGQVAAVGGALLAAAAIPLTEPGLPILVAALALVPAAWSARGSR